MIISVLFPVFVASALASSLALPEMQSVAKSFASEYETSQVNNAAEPKEILQKLDGILHRPVTTGNFRAAKKENLRVTAWNIEQGNSFDTLLTYLDGSRCKDGKSACKLAESDIFLFSEVDDGVCRSQYHSVAAELAAKLKMNSAFAPSFFEAEPSKSGLEESDGCPHENLNATKNLTGNAVLSRYPIKNVQVIPLPVGDLGPDIHCWDWHQDEVIGPSWIDRIVRAFAKIIFDENMKRELRYGSRNAVAATIELPSGPVTAVAAHLENKGPPACRRAQMSYLLKQLPDTYPVIIGGDMNTIGTNGGRRSLSKLLGFEPEQGLFDLMKENDFFPEAVTNVPGGSHYLNRTFGNIGVSRLDWIFLKDKTGCYQPGEPETWSQLLLDVGQDRFPSDHVPVSLELSARPCARPAGEHRN